VAELMKDDAREYGHQKQRRDRRNPCDVTPEYL
jgi:hypothetical protein